MYLLRAARKRIGSSPYCVPRVWSISSASPRNPPTTITTRRFRRSWILYGSQDKKKKSTQRRPDGVGVGAGPGEDEETRIVIFQHKRASRPGQNTLCVRLRVDGG